MIQAIVTPKRTELDISVHIPEDYVGKQVHVLIYKEEEVENAPVSKTSTKKPSDYFGTLSEEEGAQLHDYVKQSRKEWDRDSL